MPKLEKIRENARKNIEYERNKLNSYKNPNAINIVSKIIKHNNILLLEKYCEDNNLSEKDKKLIFDAYLKPNYYCPSVIQQKNKEKLQCFNISKDKN